MSPKIRPSKFPALQKQKKRLRISKTDKKKINKCSGMDIIVFPKVYGTSVDTELMIDTVKINNEENFLEIGCGAGAIAISLAKKAKNGIAADISLDAVKNAVKNSKQAGLKNLFVTQSDVFENIQGKFDVIVSNPPYTQHEVKEEYEKMFWDPNDDMKRTFFKEAKEYLRPQGRVYVGWADFADLDVELPFRLAEEFSYEILQIKSRKSNSGEFTFYVLELRPEA